MREKVNRYLGRERVGIEVSEGRRGMQVGSISERDRELGKVG